MTFPAIMFLSIIGAGGVVSMYLAIKDRDLVTLICSGCLTAFVVAGFAVGIG